MRRRGLIQLGSQKTYQRMTRSPFEGQGVGIFNRIHSTWRAANDRRCTSEVNTGMKSPRPSIATPESVDLGIDLSVTWRVRSRLVAALLGILVGAFGAHRFYLGYKKLAAKQFVVTIVTGGVGGLWGMYEGWRILFGRLGFDAAGHRLCHQTLIHWLAAVTAGASVTAAGIAAYSLSDLYMIRYLPPPRGANSINITASIATPESAQLPEFKVSESQARDPQNHPPQAAAGRRHTPTDSPTIEKQTVTSNLQRDPVACAAPMAGSSDLAAPTSLQQVAQPTNHDEPPVEHGSHPTTRTMLAAVARLQNQKVVVPNQVRDASSDSAADSLDQVIERRGVIPAKVESLSADSPRPSNVGRRQSSVEPPLTAPMQVSKAEPKVEHQDSNRNDQRSPERADPVVDRPPMELTAKAAASSTPSRERRGIMTGALPTTKLSPTPTYPPELLARRIEGLVKLRVRVGTDGRVKKASVYRTSGQRAFDQAAMDVIYQWEFEPARRAGVPFETEVAVPVRFFVDEQQGQR